MLKAIIELSKYILVINIFLYTVTSFIALLWDDRIQSVDGFAFDFPRKGIVHVAFTAHTVFEEVQADREVDF